MNPSVEREPIVAWLRERLPELEAIYLFGSAVRGPWRPDSDLDLAIDAGRPLEPAVRYELALELGVAMNRDVDLIDMQRANAVLRREILTTGERLYVRDRARQDALEAAMLTEYLDFAFIRQKHLEAILADGQVYGR
ncbi:MAG: nucleotidyltransferase domain-containing protein [Casimicrobiaceae bacterium]|nr:nucleotidyltransferase domain-containing protein [Casimicrobiaceae bacterium]